MLLSLLNRGIAYFIANTPSDTCNQEEILRRLHEEEMTCDVITIKTRVTEVMRENLCFKSCAKF